MKTRSTLDFQMHHREQLLNKYSFIALIRPQNIIMAAEIQRNVAASPSRCFSFIFWGFCCDRAPHPEPCAVCMHGCAWAPVSQGTLCEALAAGLLLNMKIKCERWGGEREEDRRGTDEGTQRGDDETGRAKWLSAGESWRLPTASVRGGCLVQLRPAATLVISTKHAPCCTVQPAPLCAPTDQD